MIASLVAHKLNFTKDQSIEYIQNIIMSSNWYDVSAQTPGHAQISSQTGEAPALLSVNKATLTPGQVIELSLSSRDNSTFKGFIIQARDAKIKDQQVKLNYFHQNLFCCLAH